MRAISARHRARKRNQTPSNANPILIRQFYTLANLLTRVVGVSYHVDHIKALALGGLHHHDNLVVMRGDLNIRKNASDWPWLAWFNDHSDVEPKSEGL